MLTRFTLCLAATLLVGCAMTYEAPTTAPTPASAPISTNANAALDSAQRILVNSGFQISNRSDSAGTITTLPRAFRVGPTHADCGTSAGIDYLKDNRTSTTLAYGVTVASQSITVHAMIEGEYKVGSVTNDIVLTCVSRGLLERDLLDRILAAL